MSNKEDLILDILEKTYDKVEVLSSDISEIKQEQVRQNVIVERHEARSTGLEGRVERLENKELMINGGIKVLVILAAIAGFIFEILPYLLPR